MPIQTLREKKKYPIKLPFVIIKKFMTLIDKEE